MTIREELFLNQDLKYKEFQGKLIPNIDPESIIGVRSPILKKIASKYYGTNEANDLLANPMHDYYEENLLHMLFASMHKDFDRCINDIEAFMPYIDNWAVCDMSSPKIFRKSHDILLPYVYKWISSPHIYTSRYGIRILMNEYLDADFKPEYLDKVASVNAEDYYHKMMVAWYMATALAKQYDDAVKIIESGRLDKWIHNKSIQKSVESYRVTDEHKLYLKSLRRKK